MQNMIPVSVVIITRNEAHILDETLKCIKGLTDDVVVADSGSTDETIEIALRNGARVLETTWEGFGPGKNKGMLEAKYDWILSIDADEQPDETLLKALQQANLNNIAVVYMLNFKTFLGKKLIRHGEWGSDKHIRFFNRTLVKWNDAKVHEQLIIPSGTVTKRLNGYIHHYTMKDVADYTTKMTRYALLSGENYYRSGKRAGKMKRYLSPVFSFIHNYIFKLGFLDGWEGYLIARVTAFYTLAKYARLHELNTQEKQPF